MKPPAGRRTKGKAICRMKIRDEAFDSGGVFAHSNTTTKRSNMKRQHPGCCFLIIAFWLFVAANCLAEVSCTASVACPIRTTWTSKTPGSPSSFSGQFGNRSA